MQTLAKQFAHRLNDQNTRSLELGDELFRPLDQIMKYEKEFRVTAVRFKGGTHVSFEDGSRASYDDKLQLWSHLKPEPVTLPESAYDAILVDVAQAANIPVSMIDGKANLNAIKALDLVKSHHGVADAFIMSQKGKMVDIAALVDKDEDFQEMADNFKFQLMPDDTSVFVRRLISTTNYFVCSSPSRTK